MRLIKSKVWSPADIGCLKWSCLLCGMIAGAYLPEFTRRHVWWFATAAALLGVKPVISYFGDGKGEVELPNGSSAGGGGEPRLSRAGVAGRRAEPHA